jgi:hypothetical protein
VAGIFFFCLSFAKAFHLSADWAGLDNTAVMLSASVHFPCVQPFLAGGLSGREVSQMLEDNR